MLQKLDTEHLNRLALAEALASMDPRDFDMRRRDCCICGHALRLFGRRTPYWGDWQSQLSVGATLLGLSTEQAAKHSCQPALARRPTSTTHPTDAREEFVNSAATIPSIGASLASFRHEVVQVFDGFRIPTPNAGSVPMVRASMPRRLKTYQTS